MTDQKINLTNEEQFISDYLQTAEAIDDPDLLSKLIKAAKLHSKKD